MELYEAQADKCYTMLLNSFDHLSDSPEAGKQYDTIGIGILGYRINKHIIFYRVAPHNDIEILRVLHEKMDIRNTI